MRSMKARRAELILTEKRGPRGPYLAFGLLLTPRWLARPITNQIESHAFAELNCADAARVLEGVVLPSVNQGRHCRWHFAAHRICGSRPVWTRFECGHCGLRRADHVAPLLHDLVVRANGCSPMVEAHRAPCRDRPSYGPQGDSTGAVDLGGCGACLRCLCLDTSLPTRTTA
jgi:hypothetical protein